MAAPNIVNVATITAKTVGLALTTSSQDVVTNGAGSGKVFKVNSVYVANVDGAVSADATVTWYDASSATTFNLGKTVPVPNDATLVVVDKNATIYLEEGDKISALASANGDLEITVSYEEIS